MIEWFVGVDWGSENHQACIIDGDGSVDNSARNVDGARPPGLVGAGACAAAAEPDTAGIASYPQPTAGGDDGLASISHQRI